MDRLREDAPHKMMLQLSRLYGDLQVTPLPTDLLPKAAVAPVLQYMRDPAAYLDGTAIVLLSNIVQQPIVVLGGAHQPPRGAPPGQPGPPRQLVRLQLAASPAYFGQPPIFIYHNEAGGHFEMLTPVNAADALQVTTFVSHCGLALAGDVGCMRAVAHMPNCAPILRFTLCNCVDHVNLGAADAAAAIICSSCARRQTAACAAWRTVRLRGGCLLRPDRRQPLRGGGSDAASSAQRQRCGPASDGRDSHRGRGSNPAAGTAAAASRPSTGPWGHKSDIHRHDDCGGLRCVPSAA
jgi:hypothetical protein